MSVIDTNTNVSAHLTDLKARGVTAIGRYYSSSAWKRLTRPEALAVSQAGLDLFVVFEDSGSPDLTRENGIHHGQIAAGQARAIAQPAGSAIYFALEGLPSGYKKRHLRAIEDYVGGIREAIDAKYQLGAYSDGVVCEALLDQGLCKHAWLSASSAFEGSKDFYASGRWSLAQQTPLDQNWNGVSLDLNEAKTDFGAFRIGAAPAASAQTLPAASPGAAQGYAMRARATAIAQWEFFGRQTYDIHGHKDHAGHTEAEPGFAARVGQYWLQGTNTHGVDGTDTGQPWSAAFMSWVAKQAGADARFRYSTLHAVYIWQGIRDYLQKREGAGYWTERLNEAKPEIGDIVCWGRQAGIDYDRQNNGNYHGHSDFVVEVDDQHAWIIGGNVGNSVTRRPLALNALGYLIPVVQNGENLFALMKNRIP